ncbi:unnamed protein product [Heterobilharzia americana]|nr:unnamed protein product [Heterobilharzia americana]
MDDIIFDLQESFQRYDPNSQHELIVKTEEWSRVRVNTQNAKIINACIRKVMSIFYSHSFLGCSSCGCNSYMVWTSLLASFLDSEVVLKHGPNLSSEDVLMVEFTLSGETIYLVDVLLQMNTAALAPEFAALVTKRIFSLNKLTFECHENAIRILMLYKWLDINFPHIVKPTHEELVGKYLDTDSVFLWIRQRIRTNIKLAYWRKCTTLEKTQVLLNAFDLATLATLLNPYSVMEALSSPRDDNFDRQNVVSPKKQRHNLKEKQKVSGKHHLSSAQLMDTAFTETDTEMSSEDNSLQYLSTQTEDLRTPHPENKNNPSVINHRVLEKLTPDNVISYSKRKTTRDYNRSPKRRILRQYDLSIPSGGTNPLTQQNTLPKKENKEFVVDECRQEACSPAKIPPKVSHVDARSIHEQETLDVSGNTDTSRCSPGRKPVMPLEAIEFGMEASLSSEGSTPRKNKNKTLIGNSKCSSVRRRSMLQSVNTVCQETLKVLESETSCERDVGQGKYSLRNKRPLK